MTLNPADDRFIAHLCQILPERLFSAASQKYLEEPRGRWAGQNAWLARPETTKEVSLLVKAASAAHVPILPYGGGTGLVGGQIMPDGASPLILSLERMNKIRDVYASENVLIAEAGAILSDIQTAAARVDRLFPLSLASEGSAQIGGNLATNAGGINVLRYGNARDLCIGLEAVLPDGTIWNGLSRLRKDNTGYDLRNLLIGSEGTLGIITAAALKLFSRPEKITTAFLKVSSPSAALELLSMLRDHVGETISAFELLHKQGFSFLRETLPDVRLPFDHPSEWMVLLELGESRNSGGEDALENLLTAGLEKELLIDAVIAQSETQRQEFWAVREYIPEANRLIGSVSSHDISLPLSEVAEFIDRANKMIAKRGAFRINCFGHLGDGNLHYNVFPISGTAVQDYLQERDAIKGDVHDLVHALHGSVSAEHGVGRLKVADLERYGDPTKLAIMRSIKGALDPNGIMNPGAVLKLKAP